MKLSAPMNINVWHVNFLSMSPSIESRPSLGGAKTQGFSASALICAAAMLFLCSGRVRAQETSASIRGTVVDETGGTVTGAKVTATSTDTGFERSTTTNAQGAYLLLELPVGHYRLEAEAQGFKKYLQEGISLDVDQQATVAIRLAVGTTTQEIQVVSNALMIESTSTNLGQTVGEREILDLPLNGRDFTQLGLLQTGVVPRERGRPMR
jgi:hypothetical protein